MGCTNRMEQVLQERRNGIGHTPLVHMLGHTKGVEDFLQAERIVVSSLVRDEPTSLMGKVVLLQ